MTFELYWESWELGPANANPQGRFGPKKVWLFCVFFCINMFFGCWPRKILVYRVKYFSDPPHIHNGTLEFFAHFVLFLGPLFRPGGGRLCFYLLMYTYARRIPGPGGLEPPLSKIDKNGHLVYAVKTVLPDVHPNGKPQDGLSAPQLFSIYPKGCC